MDVALPSYSTTRIVNDDVLLEASLKHLHCRVLKVVEHVDPLTGNIAVEMAAAAAAVVAVEMAEVVVNDSVAVVDAALSDDEDGIVAS